MYTWSKGPPARRLPPTPNLHAGLKLRSKHTVSMMVTSKEVVADGLHERTELGMGELQREEAVDACRSTPTCRARRRDEQLCSSAPP